MTTLLQRVKSHTQGQATSGQNTLALTLACIEHMRDNQNEWSILAYLIGKSQPAQARMVRKIVGQVLQGWRIAKDAEQPSGLRFSKIKTANQGYDAAEIEKLEAFVETKASVQSKAVADAFTPEKAEPAAPTVDKVAEHIVKYMSGKEGLSTGEIIAKVQELLAAKAV